MATLEKKENQNIGPLKKIVDKKLDMQKLSGKLQWQGNAVAAQRKLRANDR